MAVTVDMGREIGLVEARQLVDALTPYLEAAERAGDDRAAEAVRSIRQAEEARIEREQEQAAHERTHPFVVVLRMAQLIRAGTPSVSGTLHHRSCRHAPHGAEGYAPAEARSLLATLSEQNPPSQRKIQVRGVREGFLTKLSLCQLCKPDLR